VNIIHAHSPNRGSGNDPSSRINNNAHARYVRPTSPMSGVRHNNTYPRDAYCTILLWDEKFSGFLFAKTSVNKRLFYFNSMFVPVPRSGGLLGHCTRYAFHRISSPV